MANEDMSFFGLNRPEYVPATELFMAELAWSVTSDDVRKAISASIAPDGLAFGSRETHKQGKAHRTRPLRHTAAYQEASQSIAKRFGQGEQVGAGILDTLLDEIESFASEKSLRSTAIPVNLASSLLQDRRGITGKANPANIAQILEQIYGVGGGHESAAIRWICALRDAAPTGIPNWIDETLGMVLPAECETALTEVMAAKGKAVVGLREPKWLRDRSNPFRWFARSWDALCARGWVDAMPRRRFADWAACLTRTGVAATYLFEMHMSTRMVAALGSDQEAGEVVHRVIEESKRLLLWDDNKSASAADVGPSIKQLSYVGTSCQELLKRLKKDHPELPTPASYDDREDGLAEWLQDARVALRPCKREVSEGIAAALDETQSSSAKNVFETIRYSLLVRGGHQSTDLYGFLKQAGRYTCVDPGQEWLVVIASLCSSGPRQPARLADLVEALDDLGIAAPRATLIARLENYGLARSSHDADDALEIQPAF